MRPMQIAILTLRERCKLHQAGSRQIRQPPFLRLAVTLLHANPTLAQELLSPEQDRTMKVALPEHQGRVAPVFDSCRNLLIFSLVSGEAELMFREDWSAASVNARMSRLRDLGVEALLCGGISRVLEEQVKGCGIHLIPWLSGEIQDVLAAFMEGRITDPEYLMPGRLCRRRRPKRRRRGSGVWTQVQPHERST